MSLKGKTLFITGASRGIGLAIAKRAARDGANVAVVAKTAEPHPKLQGTIFTAAAEIEASGGRALPLCADVRDEASVQAAVAQTIEQFGGIDICVNNASAINLARTESIEMKRYDLIHQINVRGSFVTARACLAHLKKSANAHILNLSPPLNMRADWFADHLPYTLSKYGMSMLIFGMAEEFREFGVACNALWPRTTIATAAVEFELGGAEALRRARKPAIMADAACAIFNRPAREFTGNFLIDDDVLSSEGVKDFSVYQQDPSVTPQVDIFVDSAAPRPFGVNVKDYRRG